MATFQDLSAISQDGNFRGRCFYSLVKAAIAVMAESSATDQHEKRVVFADTVLTGGVDSSRVALAVLTNSTIAAEADASLINSGAGIADSDIEFTVNSMFNAFAGVST